MKHQTSSIYNKHDFRSQCTFPFVKQARSENATRLTLPWRNDRVVSEDYTRRFCNLLECSGLLISSLSVFWHHSTDAVRFACITSGPLRTTFFAIRKSWDRKLVENASNAKPTRVLYEGSKHSTTYAFIPSYHREMAASPPREVRTRWQRRASLKDHND
jgi:hypothetical protein